MPSKNPGQRLADILDNIDAISSFCAELDLDAFRADRKTVYAVVRALERSSLRRPGGSRNNYWSGTRRSIGRRLPRRGIFIGMNMTRSMKL
jgi:hypothetical protein